jgi:L-ribulokinase
MQIYADVLNMPITIIKSSQGPALGSAIHAAVAAGAYSDVVEAAGIMGGIDNQKYLPNPENARIYAELFRHYDALYESFGHNGMMHDLRHLRDQALLREESNV